MKSIEYFLQDPVVQLFITVAGAFFVYDVLKFILEWVWKKLGGQDDEGG